MRPNGFLPLFVIFALLAVLVAGVGTGLYFYQEMGPIQPSTKEEPKDNDGIKPVEEIPSPPSPKSPEPAPAPKPAPPKLNCVVGGCNKEICTSADEKPAVSICIFKPEFICYQKARCEVQPTGKCGWTQTQELTACIANAKTAVEDVIPPPPPPTPIPPPPRPAATEIRLEADDNGFYPSGNISVSKGSIVKLAFVVRTINVYYGGLDFRSLKFKTESVKPGGSTIVEFTADESFTITSYWPASGVRKADLRVEIK